MADLEKVAQGLPGMMQAAAQHLNKLASANVDLVKRAEAAEHELRIMKLARRMETRGIHHHLDFDTKVAQLLDVPEEKLSVMEQAVEFAAGGVTLGSLSRPESTGGGKTASTDELESYIESQMALT